VTDSQLHRRAFARRYREALASGVSTDKAFALAKQPDVSHTEKAKWSRKQFEPKWSKEMDAFLKHYWPLQTSTWIAEQLNVPRDSVCSKARRMKLRKK